MLNHESSLKVIKLYLALKDGGSLILNTEKNQLFYSTNRDEIEKEPYIIIDQFILNTLCDCGSYYNDDCEECRSQALYYLNKATARLKEISRNLK